MQLSVYHLLERVSLPPNPRHMVTHMGTPAGAPALTGAHICPSCKKFFVPRTQGISASLEHQNSHSFPPFPLHYMLKIPEDF